MILYGLLRNNGLLFRARLSRELAADWASARYAPPFRFSVECTPRIDQTINIDPNYRSCAGYFPSPFWIPRLRAGSIGDYVNANGSRRVRELHLTCVEGHLSHEHAR